MTTLCRPLKAVLFDLDGTLIDSAPDLAAAANGMRAHRGLEPVPYPALRSMVGSGARGMIHVAFGVTPASSDFVPLRDEFLSRYERGLLDQTAVFAPMRALLDALDAAGTRWGIVTNKVERYTRPIVAGLGLEQRAAVVICGDTTPHAKPHPGPLLEAARRMGVEPSACAYVGDDLRDVQAGRSAGMQTVVAAWGYLGQGDAVEHWGADDIVLEPYELLNCLQLA